MIYPLNFIDNTVINKRKKSYRINYSIQNFDIKGTVDIGLTSNIKNINISF